MTRRSRTTRDLQQLVGRRGPRAKEAVLWGDLDTLTTELVDRYRAAGPSIITAIGAMPANEAERLINDTITYINNEIADTQQVVQDEITSARAYTDALTAETRDFLDTDIAETRAFVESLFDNLESEVIAAIPRLTSAERQIDDLMQSLIALSTKVLQTDERVANAGIYVDQESGEVKIAALEQVFNRLSTAELSVSGAESAINARVTYTEMNMAISEAMLDPESIPIVDELELRMAAAEVDINALEASILLKADNTTVSGIDVRLGTAEIDIDALESSITLLAQQSDLEDLESRVSSAEIEISAIDGASIRQTVADSRSTFDALDEASMATLGSLLDAYKSREALRVDLAFARTEINAEVNDRREAVAQARTEIGALIDGATAMIIEEQNVRASETEALSGQLLTINAAIQDAESAITAEQIARAAADDALASDITTLTVSVGDNAASITAEQLARANADQVFASQISTLTSDLDAAEAAITNEAFTRAQNDNALASQISTISTALGQAEAAITAEQSARASADAAIVADVSNLTAALGDAESAISAESTARASADSALASQFNNISTSLGLAEAAIDAETLARTNADDALAAQIVTLSAALDQNTADISTEQTARVNADQALAFDISSLETSFNNLDASVTQNANAIATQEGYAAATFAIRAKAGGATAEAEFVAADNPISGAASAIRFTADDIILNGTVSAPLIKAGTITSDLINVEELVGSAAFLEYLEVKDANIESLSAEKVQGDLKSSNFSTGVSGWRIRPNGSAEFNGPVISRQIQVASGSTYVGNVGNGSETLINTGIPISAWSGAKKTYIAAVSNAGTVSASLGTPETSRTWGFEAKILPLTRWSGVQTLHIIAKAYLANVVSTDLTLNWRVYEVT